MTILLLLFLSCYASNNFFPHAHKVGTQWVFHSHPYGSSSADTSGGHQHSSESIRTIHSFSSSFLFVESLHSFCLIKQTYSLIRLERPDDSFLCSLHTYSPLRAPPVA